jgi:hypothetical protein
MKASLGSTTRNPAGSPKVRSTPTAGNSQTENFEKLAGKLVQVPKSEIDEKRQKA